jgi:hypothetical protein
MVKVLMLHGGIHTCIHMIFISNRFVPWVMRKGNEDKTDDAEFVARRKAEPAAVAWDFGGRSVMKPTLWLFNIAMENPHF